MRLTMAGEYGVRCVLYLSFKKFGEVVSRMEIAESMHIPAQFLSKIAQQLARAGIIEIVQGAKGGFKLLVEPKNLSLLDVIEAISGEIFLNECVIRPGVCRRSGFCSINKVWEEARDSLRSILKKATFETLIKEESCLNPAIWDETERKVQANR